MKAKVAEHRTGGARAEHLVDRLALPEAWTVEDLTAALNRERGTAIVWVPVPPGFPSVLCGVHLVGREVTVVGYRHSDDSAVCRQAYAHAAAHLLLDNGHEINGVPQVLAALVSGYDGEDSKVDAARAECEADRFAVMILLSPSRLSGQRGPTWTTSRS